LVQYHNVDMEYLPHERPKFLLKLLPLLIYIFVLKNFNSKCNLKKETYFYSKLQVIG